MAAPERADSARNIKKVVSRSRIMQGVTDAEDCESCDRAGLIGVEAVQPRVQNCRALM